MYQRLLRSSVLWPTLRQPRRLLRRLGHADRPLLRHLHAADARRGRRRRLGHRGLLLVRLRQHPLRLPRLAGQRPRRRRRHAHAGSRTTCRRPRRTGSIAFWHHPPYSKGSHDSDTEIAADRDAPERAADPRGRRRRPGAHRPQPLLRALLSCSTATTALSSTLQPSMMVDGGDGRVGRRRRLPQAEPGAGRPHEGAVYAVAGSSGQTSGGTLNHPAMFVSLNELGSLVLDVDGAGSTRSSSTASGVVRDHFTILKADPICPPTPRSGCRHGAALALLKIIDDSQRRARPGRLRSGARAGDAGGLRRSAGDDRLRPVRLRPDRSGARGAARRQRDALEPAQRRQGVRVR